MGISRSTIVASCALVLGGSSGTLAEPKAAGKSADTATGAYLLMREKLCAAPVTAATLSPYLSVSRRGYIEPAPGSAKSWLNCKAKVTVARENPPGEGGIVELKLAGTEGNQSIQGGAWLVKEDGAWKLDDQVIVPK